MPPSRIQAAREKRRLDFNAREASRLKLPPTLRALDPLPPFNDTMLVLAQRRYDTALEHRAAIDRVIAVLAEELQVLLFARHNHGNAA